MRPARQQQPPGTPHPQPPINRHRRIATGAASSSSARRAQHLVHNGDDSIACRDTPRAISMPSGIFRRKGVDPGASSHRRPPSLDVATVGAGRATPRPCAAARRPRARQRCARRR
jgi:hypothetical protein